MTDIGLTIAPKSDQLNSDDLIAGPLTIKITKVSANPESSEQPISIYFEGDGGKPYRPCKSMRRVMVNVWGRDGNTYPGRSMTLYRDDKVLFGGLAVGGIRISHMSHTDKDVMMVLTASRASRKPFTIRPLVETAPVTSPAPKRPTVAEWIATQGALFDACKTDDAVDAVMAASDIEGMRGKLQPASREKLDAMIAAARARVAVAPPVENAPENAGGEDWFGHEPENAEQEATP